MKAELREPMIVPGGLNLAYKYYAGSVASKFFRELRERAKILGTKCRKCNMVYAPPQSTCHKCFGKLGDEWVELEGTGALTAYSVVHYSLPIHPVQPPFAYGIVKLDGADTGTVHLLAEVDLDKLEIGMRVEPVFREKREGNILDIRYFRPLANEARRPQGT